uniref:UPAR/Ly6 domain-containing protein n=1 Tax=Cryptomonas curvata TaxID=233186 RepID=A0A7S0R1K6_9CRYP|mmetsp:Transcript_934/g.1995  ORF Transcript_934/g.1995 Transcript_934/m.1995 type:complete len:158 (+) Transcript_934:15-488(+)
MASVPCARLLFTFAIALSVVALSHGIKCYTTSSCPIGGDADTTNCSTIVSETNWLTPGQEPSFTVDCPSWADRCEGYKWMRIRYAYLCSNQQRCDATASFAKTVGGDDYNSVCCSTDLCNRSPAAPRRPAGAAAVLWWSAAIAAAVFASVAPSLASA